MSAHILLVDESPDARVKTLSLLSRQGYQVDTASCGKNALALASAGDFDCIVLDYNLGDMTGIEFILDFRRRPTGVDVPIIMLSNDHRTVIADQCRRAGAWAYLVKPAGLRSLIPRIERLIALRNGDASTVLGSSDYVAGEAPKTGA